MKKMLVAFILFGVVTAILAACNAASPSSSGGGNSVHMNETDFVQKSITIKKGSSFNLIDDAAVIHIITNGSWDSNGTPKPKQEPGAPKVDIQFQGNDTHAVGPFNTAGTYHLYCTIHDNMNLTVIVQ